MAFEETLVFYDPGDAEEFSKKLREAGSRAKTKVVKALVKDTRCRAEIKNFQDYFTEESENFADDDSEISSLMHETYSMVIAEMQALEEALKDFLDSYADGDCISDDSDVSRYLELSKEDGKISELTEYARKEDDPVSKIIRIYPVLEDNGMIEDKDGKKYLKNKKEAGTLLTSLPSDILLEGSSAEARQKFGIKTIIDVMSGSEYHVSTPPEFIFGVDLNELDGIVEGLNIGKDSYIRLKENIFLKTLIAGRIIDFLKEKEKASADEIVEEIKDVKISIKETGDEFAFDLETDYIKGILADMKKLDIIKGKGSRYRI